MASNKFEEYIKDKLEERRIVPSDNSWSRLIDKLDAEDGGSKSRMVWWLGIAASIVGVFLITSLIFNNIEEEAVSPTLVETPVEQLLELNETKDSEINASKTKTISISEIESKQKPSVTNQFVTKKPVVLKKEKIIIPNKEDVLENVAEKIQFETTESKRPEQIIKDQNINEALAEISQVEENRSSVSDSEIESLLQLAHKNVATNSILVKKETVVDASSLLQDVETDLDESFRDKIFNAIVSGYTTVVTAVGERND